MDELALFGGAPAVGVPHPHAPWPPPAGRDELAELAEQRDLDIRVRGRGGPVRRLEEQFLAFLGDRRYAVSFNSGTSALFAAYFALGVRPGTEVVGPALTYHAALSPAYALGGDVVLADIDRDSRCLDPARIERAITERTRVLAVVHQWGHPADMDRILPIARRHGLRLLEDCSHAHGSRYRGRLCGTFGDAAVFSLQANKAVFAGEGGILVTGDAEVRDRATLLGHCRDRSRDEVADPQLREFWVTGFGLKLRMSPFNAIVASHSLRDLPAVVAGRRRCLDHFRRRLAEIPYLEPPRVAGGVEMGAWYGFKPLYRPEVLDNLPMPLLVEALRAEGLDVTAASGPCLATLPLYSRRSLPVFPDQPRRGNDPADLPVAAEVAERSLSLPTFYRWPRDRQVIDEYVAGFRKVGSGYRALAAGASPRPAPRR